MRPIPPRVRAEMAEDPFYKACCLGPENCAGRIEWHHVFIYAGRQVNEKWAIVPACHRHHEAAAVYNRDFQKVALSRATPEDLAKYPKKNWSLLR